MEEIRKELQDLKEDLLIENNTHLASRVGYIQQLLHNLKDK
jgi:hypothetical protein